MLNEEQNKSEINFTRIKKILIAGYLENKKFEAWLNQKGIAQKFAEEYGAAVSDGYKIDLSATTIDSIDADQIIPVSLHRGLFKSEKLHTLIHSLMEETIAAEKLHLSNIKKEVSLQMVAD